MSEQQSVSSTPTNTRRHVLVTGASTGIGADAAQALAQSGWYVLAGVRKPEDGQRLVEVFEGAATAGRSGGRSAAGGRIEPLLLDVTNADQIAAAAQHIDATVGPGGLEALVNNAGIVVSGPLEMIPLDRFRYQLEVNVTGLLAVTRACLPLLRNASRSAEQREGGTPRIGARIVNISSVNGALAPPYMGPYAASKHAVEAISDSLRIELRRWRIHIALVEPGPVATPIWDKAKKNAETMETDLPPEASDLYGGDVDAMREAVHDLADKAIPVERVTRQVVHALEARRPRFRYFPTWEARLSHKVFRMVPEPWRDAIVRRALGLKP